MKKYILVFFFAALFLSSCTKDNGSGPPPPGEVSGGIYIVNEGSFGQNNSSVSFYNPQTGEVINNAYSDANSGASLGDNGNHLFVSGSKGYIAVNGSNKIEIIDMKSFISLGFVNLGQGSSPREVWVKDSTSGYVTSLLGQVIKFDPSTLNVLSNVTVGSYPEGIAEASGKLFVANSWFGDTLNLSNILSVIDLSTDIEIQQVQVGLNPTKVLTGPDGNIYVITTGSYTNPAIFSGVYIINPSLNIVTDSIAIRGNPFEGCFISSSRMLVINAEGVMDVDLITRTVSQDPLIPTSAVTTFQFGLIYSAAYDDKAQNILCGNPKDFQQNGEVVFFDLNGTEQKRINVGINPGTIVVNY